MRTSIFCRRVGLLCCAMIIALSGCARFSTEKGVETRWRGDRAPVFERGVTTNREVLEVLGPPSQIINLDQGSAYYYLKEHGAGKAMILLLYNTSDYRVTYDRAVFFFDAEGVLEEYAYSNGE